MTTWGHQILQKNAKNIKRNENFCHFFVRFYTNVEEAVLEKENETERKNLLFSAGSRSINRQKYGTFGSDLPEQTPIMATPLFSPEMVAAASTMKFSPQGRRKESHYEVEEFDKFEDFTSLFSSFKNGEFLYFLT